LKFHHLHVLTDENISPKLVQFLREQGLDVIDTKEQGWFGKSDDELMEIAYKENRWVLTHDSDFGSLAIHEGKPYWGIIFFRVKNMQSQNVVRVCNQLLLRDIDFVSGTLMVVEEARIRIRQADKE